MLSAERRRHSYSTASYATKVAKRFVSNAFFTHSYQCSWLTLGGHARRSRHRSARALPQPPAEFFEPDRIDVEVPNHLSPAQFYVLHHLKCVFQISHTHSLRPCCRSLELPLSWTLNPSDVETFDIQSGEYIFRPGDQDVYLYVLLSGRLSVNIMTANHHSAPQNDVTLSADAVSVNDTTNRN